MKQRKNNTSSDHLRVKALGIYGRLCSEASEEVSNASSFNASRGCFSKFVNHHRLHNLAARGEQASVDHEAAERYPLQLRAMIAEFGITPKQALMQMKPGFFGNSESSESLPSPLLSLMILTTHNHPLHPCKAARHHCTTTYLPEPTHLPLLG
ncbi:tigger transposable element-derived protein 1-like [Mobula hypostoma]|uniref:tigger transposable element-derived protein 1-like n=1 Tax=Mobula hypostoma TaxID=723540 RepID=UPI002FC2C0B0